MKMVPEDITNLIQTIALVLNTLVLLFVLFRHVMTLSSHKLETEKLKREIESLKEEQKRESALIVKATHDEIERYVAGPQRKLIENLCETHERSAQNLLEAISAHSDKEYGRSRELSSELSHLTNQLRKFERSSDISEIQRSTADMLRTCSESALETIARVTEEASSSIQRTTRTFVKEILASQQEIQHLILLEQKKLAELLIKDTVDQLAVRSATALGNERFARPRVLRRRIRR